MRTKSSERRLDDVGFLLAKASQRFNELLVDGFTASGFPEVKASYGSVLMPLFDEDDLRIGELAARSALSKQSMTALVRGCEEAGLVERRRDPEDGRASRVRLTRRGRRFKSAATEIQAELDARVLAELGRTNRDALVRALRGVLQL
jgi:DNA-binding MarR family transcriptional regulator